MAKTSVYLSKDRQARMDALAVPLLAVLDAGLNALEHVGEHVPGTYSVLLAATDGGSVTIDATDAAEVEVLPQKRRLHPCCKHCHHGKATFPNGHPDKCRQCPAGRSSE